MLPEKGCMRLMCFQEQGNFQILIRSKWLKVESTRFLVLQCLAVVPESLYLILRYKSVFMRDNFVRRLLAARHFYIVYTCQEISIALNKTNSAYFLFKCASEDTCMSANESHSPVYTMYHVNGRKIELEWGGVGMNPGPLRSSGFSAGMRGWGERMEGG